MTAYQSPVVVVPAPRFPDASARSVATASADVATLFVPENGRAVHGVSSTEKANEYGGGSANGLPLSVTMPYVESVLVTAVPRRATNAPRGSP